ncbi:MarR family winged helix-turn-helix transcriptional regulator [Desulfovibrio sp. OttesenSCG-928-M16]|nr:MarR family winged helix-turn-helix transcriptional regulator [Desulfovibrio sp. OttesenSCG-928-M16]
MKPTPQKTIEQYYLLWFGLNELYALWAKQHGLTVNALFTLYVIQNVKNCTQQDICKMLMLSKQTVNSLLKNFEGLGYITKQTVPSDKRSKALALTPLGNELAVNLLSKLYSAESKALQAMSREQMEGFIKGMNSFLKNFRETTKL